MQTAKIKKQKVLPSDEDTESSPSCSNVPKMNANNLETCSDIFFERIYSGMVFPRMPNTAWAIHCSPLPVKKIVVSELGTFGINNYEIAPLYMKQIVFDSKLNFEVFLINTRMVLKDKLNVPRSIEEFEDIVAYVSDIKLCPGGPPVSEYSNSTLECAYKDPTERWRHNLCSLEIVGELVCKSCFSLEELLQKLQRNKLSGRTLPPSKKEKRKVGLKRAKRF